MGRSQRTSLGRSTWIGLLMTSVVVLGGLVSPAPAWAHGEGETTEAYLLVQQALGHLAHDASSDGVMAALEKIDDALSSMDQEGVDVAMLERGRAALEAGQVAQGRALLQNSITEAITKLKPANGEETGTTIVLDPLPGRSSLTAEDIGFLFVSALFLLLGVGLAWRFKPQDNIQELRRRLRPPEIGQPTAEPVESAEDGS